jgi:hypothetical protein
MVTTESLFLAYERALQRAWGNLTGDSSTLDQDLAAAREDVLEAIRADAEVLEAACKDLENAEETDALLKLREYTERHRKRQKDLSHESFRVRLGVHIATKDRLALSPSGEVPRPATREEVTKLTETPYREAILKDLGDEAQDILLDDPEAEGGPTLRVVLAQGAPYPAWERAVLRHLPPRTRVTLRFVYDH